MISIAKNMKNEPQSLKNFKTKKENSKSKNIYEKIALIKRETNLEKQTKLRYILRGDKNGKKGIGIFDTYVNEYDSKELRKILLEEQGHICCYCMNTIFIAKEGRIEGTKIEHYKPRDGNEECELDYDNLYLACDGEKVNCNENQDQNKNIHNGCKCKCRKEENHKKIVKHCDTCKGNRPLDYINFRNIKRQIKYKSDGTIYSDNENIDKELNYVLNLNLEILKKNRKYAKIDFWGKLPQDKTWNIQKIIEKYEQQSKKAPYLGMLLYFLTKTLKSKGV